MDTSLYTHAPTATVAQPTIVTERAKTTKVQAVDTDSGPATLPANKPFVAQIVTARLSGTDYPDNPAEIAPPDRTLRPYGVPMLPYQPDESTAVPAGSDQDPIASVLGVADDVKLG